MKLLRARLRDESFAAARGSGQAAMVFVDDEEFPGGIRPTGRYTVSGTNVVVTMRLRRDGAEIANLQITGSRDDLPALIEKIIGALKERIAKVN
jgi:hypothetical protein